MVYCILVLTLYTFFGRNFCIFLCCKFHIIQVCIDSSLFLHCCACSTAVKKFWEKLNMQNKFFIHCKERLEIKSILCSIRPFVIVTCVRGRKSSILFFLLLLPSYFTLLHVIHAVRTVLTAEWERTHHHCKVWLRIFDLRRVPSNYLSLTCKKKAMQYNINFDMGSNCSTVLVYILSIQIKSQHINPALAN